MNLFKTKKMNIEEEVEFLFENDLKRQEKLRYEKFDIQTMRFIQLALLAFLTFIFLKELREMSAFIYLYVWIAITIVWGLFKPNDKLKYLQAIDLLKRKFKEDENASGDSDAVLEETK